MKKVLGALVISCIQATTSYGTPAFFKDSLLSIKEGIVVLGEEVRYYRNLQMQLKENGDFRVVEGESLMLAQVDEMEVTVVLTQPNQVELLVKGHKSTPCIDLKTAVTREGNTFYFAIAESPQQTFDVCVQVLDPFEISTELDTSGLAKGDYLIRVNDDEIDFEIE